MAVPAVISDGRMTDEDLAATIEAFHDLHEELHTYAVREEEPMIRSARVKTVGLTEKPALREYGRTDAPIARALRSRRPVWFGGRFEDTPVYDGDELGLGHEIEGPAIVEERFTTIVIHPGQTGVIDSFGNYVITLP
jgi:N-methylhydantoinase A